MRRKEEGGKGGKKKNKQGKMERTLVRNYRFIYGQPTANCQKPSSAFYLSSTDTVSKLKRLKCTSPNSWRIYNPQSISELKQTSLSKNKKIKKLWKMLQSFREYFFKRSIKILQDFLCQSCLTISIPHFCLYNTYMGVFFFFFFLHGCF